MTAFQTYIGALLPDSAQRLRQAPLSGDRMQALRFHEFPVVQAQSILQRGR